MSMDSRLRRVEEAAKPGSPEPGQMIRTITPSDPQYDEVMTALVDCGAAELKEPNQ